jgi:hypothetical protein
MDMHVHKTGTDDEAFGIDQLSAVRIDRTPKLGNYTFIDKNVTGFIEILCRIDQPSSLNE